MMGENIKVAQESRSATYLKYLSYAIILVGITLRLCIYFQNRNLFLDEANVARNVFERGYIGLTHPLSYYQFAPPLFLWTLKFFTNLLGYSEYAYKILPLVSAIGGLLIFYQLLKKYGIVTVAWYPLMLFASGFIYLRYATEVKQYSSDSFITLALIYLALSVEYKKVGLVRFILIWFVAGSIAIWASMPSVFVLGGIGAYYFAVFVSERDFKAIGILAVSGILWLVQFIIYYEIILKPQIQSDYLQNFHRSEFITLIPHTKEELYHNFELMIHILGVSAGHWGLSVGFHIAAILVAGYYAIRQRLYSILLLVIPMVLVLLASALHQFTLMPRVVLFVMPLIVIFLSIGVQQIFQNKYVRVPILIIAAICLFNFSQFKYFYKPLQVEQVTESMKVIQQEHIPGSHIYIHAASYPSYIYYTTIHPDQGQWSDIKGGKGLEYTEDFDALARSWTGRNALLYNYEHPESVADQQQAVNKYVNTVRHFSAMGSEVFIYVPR